MSPGPELAAAPIAPAGHPNRPPEYFAASPVTSSSTQAHHLLSINTSIPPRSTSLGFPSTMGQSFSRSAAAANSPSGPPPSPSTPRGLGAAMASGIRLKRAFANRRKKSEDVTKQMDRSLSKDDTAQDHFRHQHQRIQATPSSSSSPAKLQVFTVGSSKKSSKYPALQPQQPSSQQQQLPPPTPPKPAAPAIRPPPDARSSIIPISPGISSAVDFLRREEAQKVQHKDQQVKANENNVQEEENTQVMYDMKEDKFTQQAVGEKSDSDGKGELKDSWRKSDSTISHHTIRPGGRPSRPVSMADSLQSNHTIVPVSKRQSALVDDADFGMPEEDDSSAPTHDLHDKAGSPSGPGFNDITPTTTDFHSTSGPSHKTRDHRSMSLNINMHASPLKQILPPTPSSASASNLSHSISEHSQYPPSTKGSSTGRDVPPGLPARLPVFALHSTSDNNARGAWSGPGPQYQQTAFPLDHTSRTMPSNPYTTFPPPPEPSSSSSQKKSSARHDRSLPSLPLQQPRQPTISMSSGFGLAKRAVEKMGLGRALGMGSSSSSAHGHTPSSTSGYSSSSSGHTTYTTFSPIPAPHPPSSYSKHGTPSGSPGSVYTNNELSRTSSGQSSHNHHSHTGIFLHKKHRLKQHNANAPSVSSITSASTSASASDSDVMMQDSGQFLGKLLRGPVKRGGGVVFGRDLASVVRETGVRVGPGAGKAKGWSGRWKNWEGSESESEAGKGDVEGTAVGGRARKGSVRKGQLKALEERKLPSLVVRCAQHLLIWGVQEEGLFRIPGRALHVSRLRAEFDSGADYDMTECSPSDLDPHAVASVFKAYLRELPEPILTNALLPYFDAAMTQEGLTNANNNANSALQSSVGKIRGPGLPTDPRNRPAMIPGIRKPPSLSTLAAPNFAGLRPPSKLLLDTFRSLLARLPEENRDLIRTVAELIRATALDSHETKMPMSNLLLVFCPSLNMNPPLLRVLCEADGIWEDPVPVAFKHDNVSNVVAAAPIEDRGEESEGALKDGLDDDGERESLQSESVGRTSEDVPSSLGYLASTEDVAQGQRWGSASAHRDINGSFTSQRVRLEAHDRKPSLAASSVIDDESSSDMHSRTHSSPLLTSSAESLETPDTSFLPSLVPHLPNEDESKSSQQQERPSLDSAESEQPPAELSPVTPRRPVISNPIPITGLVQFPATIRGGTPPSPAKAERRRSIPILSLPNLSLGSSTPGSPESSALSLASRAKRLKKPSLHLLFKKSNSSFSSSNAGSPAKSIRPTISNPYLQAPESASDSSISTPLSAVTAPQASPYGVPPKLNTPIENSSLRLGLGLNSGDLEATSSPTEHTKQGKVFITAADRSLPTPPESSTLQHQPSDSVASPSTSSPTPIADRYRSSSPYPSLSLASKSQLSLAAPEEYETPPSSAHLRARPIVRSRVLSTASNASSHLDLLDGEKPEEWTRSVLLAADADNDWAIQQQSVA